ncbi:hypothetical protein BC792_11770 [Sphingobacterium allocomposti]|uniref:Uncharacterized protein n=1 Tax=Sphingobacterium allocomposti TaxID=415956 RepID=A0A5S5D9E6_9SPHI|nr:hypothetical protein BC792_11770 [Sphingobacterium composti Yoo et al. 2007 non Ten et al. 2007]
MVSRKSFFNIPRRGGRSSLLNASCMSYHMLFPEKMRWINNVFSGISPSETKKYLFRLVKHPIALR